MLTVALAIAITLTEIDTAAREDAERMADAAVAAYARALMAGEADAVSLETLVSRSQISLHAIYERDRMRQIDLALDIDRLRSDGSADAAELQRLEEELALLGAIREEYLFRRTATEKKQHELLTFARRFRL